MQVFVEQGQHGLLRNPTMFLCRLARRLQIPPPLLWLSNHRLVQRIGGGSPWLLSIELLQQFHWWLIRPWRLKRQKAFLSLPWHLTLRACWLNSYRPGEVAWWWAIGVRSWRQLASHLPDSLAAALHRERRRAWPDQSEPALRLLADKASLLASTPEVWRAPFLLLEPMDGVKEAPSPITPPWWDAALMCSGLVLKPQRGHAGRHVVRFRYTENGLEQSGLFRHLASDAPLFNGIQLPTPPQLLRHWQRLCGIQEPALAGPYLNHSMDLPTAEPSVVVRVITTCRAPALPIEVEYAWLEVPLGHGVVSFISLDGAALPSPGLPLTSEQQVALAAWVDLLRSGRPPACVKACVEAAKVMHALLPPIDQIAWDWIPAEPEPLLLEGNGGFGLLVPQLFAQLQRGARDALNSRAQS